MKKGLGLYRVQIDDARIPVYQAVIPSSPILTRPTRTPFPRGNPASPGAQFTLDLAPIERSEVGGELCLNKALLRHLCMQGFREGGQLSGPENTEARAAELQKVSLSHLGTGYALVHRVIFHLGKNDMIFEMTM
jgi:hypothetical protein